MKQSQKFISRRVNVQIDVAENADIQYKWNNSFLDTAAIESKILTETWTPKLQKFKAC